MTETEDDQSNQTFKKTKVQTQIGLPFELSDNSSYRFDIISYLTVELEKKIDKTIGTDNRSFC